ncbi:MAG: response regulator transcription factor [Lachnospiraceae bacterium]|jgi:DNA-binding LytR/AlgR family response regulator|nr:response regulator transcription factor [Lachnospiraceae bacterium]
MLRVAICDDEKILMEIEEIAGRFFRLNCIDSKITTYQSSENLQYDLQDGIVYDLFLLDIEMPEIHGMELAKEICERMPSAKIIFITSHPEYAITAYEYSVFRYIQKTMLHEKLFLALEDYYRLYALEKNEYYMIEIKNYLEKIPYRSIFYVLKEGKYSVLYLEGERTVSVRKPLKQVFEELGQEYFYFADRGCIINLANVVGMDTGKILFPEQQNVTINKTNWIEFKENLLSFWGKQI